MYDYIVVGSGSAGAVIATRLSEDPEVQVLLVEAGGEPTGDAYTVPSQFSRQMKTDGDWDFYSESEPHLARRQIDLPRGRVLGGTSSMNAMIYIRGSRVDFDEWRDEYGCAGWGWNDVLPYFLRAEGNVRPADALHANDGPLGVGDRLSDNPLTEAWVQAAQEAGHPYNPDFNGPDQEGVGFYQLTQREGKRSSTAEAYLKPNKDRPNLEILTHARATRILFEGTKAVGIEVERFGEIRSLHAAHEVILSAGAYNSPQLLMLSGIGPADQLASFGIACRADLPVGENLQDHSGVPIVMGTRSGGLYRYGTQDDWDRYHLDGGGPLNSNVVEAGGFFRTSPSLNTPDVQAIVLPSTFSDPGPRGADLHAYTSVAEVTRPDSVGWVRLRSTNPSAKVRILHNHFAEEYDRQTVLAGMRILMDIAEQPSLTKLEASRVQFPESRSDEDLLRFMRAYGIGWYHPSSTCAMGKVVDSDLRVMGVEGLRVADASIMPRIVRGNPNASIIMIGEKAADLIRGRSLEAAATDRMASQVIA